MVAQAIINSTGVLRANDAAKTNHRDFDGLSRFVHHAQGDGFDSGTGKATGDIESDVA